MNKIDSIDKELLKLFEAERQTLLTADLGSMEGIAQQKMALLTQLKNRPTRENEEMTRKLADKAAANHSLIQAALSGMRSAMTRIDEAKNIGKSFKTYDNMGRSTLPENKTPANSRKV